MPKFKMGDKVRCTNNVSSFKLWDLIIGGIYTVGGFEKHNGNILLLDGPKPTQGHWPSRFELVADHIEGSSDGMALLSIGSKVNCIEPYSSQGGKFCLANSQFYVISKVHHGIGYELEGLGNTIFRAARFESAKQKKRHNKTPDFVVGDIVRNICSSAWIEHNAHYMVSMINGRGDMLKLKGSDNIHPSDNFEVVQREADCLYAVPVTRKFESGDWVRVIRNADHGLHKLPMHACFQVDEMNGSARVYLVGQNRTDTASNRVDYGAARFELVLRPNRAVPKGQIEPKCVPAIRVGSTVRCIKGYGPATQYGKELIEGRCYTVRYISSNGNYKLDECPNASWTPGRFELVPLRVRHYAIKEIPFGVDIHEIDGIRVEPGDRVVMIDCHIPVEPQPKPIDWFSPMPYNKLKVVRHARLPAGALKQWPNGLMEGAVLLNELRSEPSVQPTRSGALRHARRTRHA